MQTQPGILAAIADTKQFRKDLDAALTNLKKAMSHENCPTKGVTPKSGARYSDERANAVVKLKEAIMWLGMDLKAINEESPGAQPNPCPESYNPTSPKIEQTADGLKL